MQGEVDPCVVEQLKLKLTSHVAVAAAVAVAPSVAGGVCLLAAALDSLSALRCIMPGWKKNIPACLQPDQEGGTTKPATMCVCLCVYVCVYVYTNYRSCNLSCSVVWRRWWSSRRRLVSLN